MYSNLNRSLFWSIKQEGLSILLNIVIGRAISLMAVSKAFQTVGPEWEKPRHQMWCGSSGLRFPEVAGCKKDRPRLLWLVRTAWKDRKGQFHAGIFRWAYPTCSWLFVRKGANVVAYIIGSDTPVKLGKQSTSRAAVRKMDWSCAYRYQSRPASIILQ